MSGTEYQSILEQQLKLQAASDEAEGYSKEVKSALAQYLEAVVGPEIIRAFCELWSTSDDWGRVFRGGSIRLPFYSALQVLGDGTLNFSLKQAARSSNVPECYAWSVSVGHSGEITAQLVVKAEKFCEWDPTAYLQAVADLTHRSIHLERHRWEEGEFLGEATLQSQSTIEPQQNKNGEDSSPDTQAS